jgi:Bifunctional DNA primase/polymerase, N-terminal
VGAHHDTDLVGAALAAAQQGISVIPLHTPVAGGCSCWKAAGCSSPGKHPRIDWRPYQERRATPAEIGTWWSHWPAANLGFITGMISGICVVDIDPRNNGFNTLEELDAYNGRMPDDNPLVETGSLGLHHYFALDAPLPKAAPFQGIEIQADGALVVAPPSLHASGRRYQWLRPLDSPWTPVPDWIRWAVEQTEEDHTPVVPLPNADQDDVLGALVASGLYLAPHRRRGLHRVRCPWAGEHSNSDIEAVVVEPGASPAPGWGFRCLHAHCGGRRIGELLDVLEIPRRRAS